MGSKTNKDNLKQLHTAISQGQRARIEKLLSKAKDPSLLNKKDSKGYTALMHAFTKENADLSICTYLIEQGADIYTTNHEGQNLLLIAAEKNKPAFVRMLLGKEAAIQSNRLISEQGGEAMKIALEGKYFDVIQPLLEAGIDIYATNSQGSLLLIAVEENQPALVRMLLDREPVLNSRIVKEQEVKAIESALRKGYFDIVQIFLEKGVYREDLLKLEKFEFKALIQKISNKKTSQAFRFCEYLVHHFSEKIGLVEGLTPLHYASHLLNDDMVRFFLAEGADPNQVNKNGWTALYYAVEAIELQPDKHQALENIVESLLVAKADPNLNNDCPVLVEAVYINLESIVEKLLKHKADPNLVDKKGGSPLMVAVAYGRSIKIVRDLVKAGADVSRCTPHTNCSLLHLTVATDNEKIKRVSSIKQNQKLGGYRFEILKFLLEQPGLDVNSVDKEGQPPLAWAFSFFREGRTAQKIMMMLRDKGADLNQKDHEGHTPRDIAPAKALEYFNSASPVKKERSSKESNTRFFELEKTTQIDISNGCQSSLTYRSK